MTFAALGWLQRIGFAIVFVCFVAQPVSGEEVSRPNSKQDGSSLFSAGLIDFNNQPANLSGFRGKPLIVNFWARWCGPCKVEIPELISLQKRNVGVEIVGLNIESTPASVRDFARAYDINYPVLLTREAGIPLMQALGNKKAVLPFTVVLNRHGAIVSTHLGAMTREKLDDAVQLALKPIPEPGLAP